MLASCEGSDLQWVSADRVTADGLAEKDVPTLVSGRGRRRWGQSSPPTHHGGWRNGRWASGASERESTGGGGGLKGVQRTRAQISVIRAPVREGVCPGKAPPRGGGIMITIPQGGRCRCTPPALARRSLPPPGVMSQSFFVFQGPFLLPPVCPRPLRVPSAPFAPPIDGNSAVGGAADAAAADLPHPPGLLRNAQGPGHRRLFGLDLNEFKTLHYLVSICRPDN